MKYLLGIFTSVILFILLIVSAYFLYWYERYKNNT